MFITIKNSIIDRFRNDKGLSEEFINDAFEKSKRSSRKIAKQMSKAVVHKLHSLERRAVLHYIDQVPIPVYHPLDYSKHELMIEALSEFLPKDFLQISKVDQLLFVLEDYESKIDSGSLISSSQIVEMCERSKAVADRRLRSLAGRAVVSLKRRMNEMSKDGTLSFKNPSIDINLPSSMCHGYWGFLSAKTRMCETLRLILQESISDRIVVVRHHNDNSPSIYVILQM